MRLSKILLFLLFINESQALCLPEAHLQHLSLKNATHLNTIYVAEKNEYAEVIGEFKEQAVRYLPDQTNLDIELDLTSRRVNAQILKEDETKFRMVIWGGMIGHYRMSLNAFKLLLCHEIGHASGGAPFQSIGGWSSVEGQADYFSSNICIKDFGLTSDQFMQAALDLTSIYAEMMRSELPSLSSRVEKPAARTIYGYPSAQCRLDTLIDGWFNRPRPSCWYREEI
jgi:hypothetical protein